MQNVGQGTPTTTDGRKPDRVNGAGTTQLPATASSSNSSPTKSETDTFSEIQPRFMSESSESEDDDVSEVESFVIDQVGELDEGETRIQSSKFLLSQDDSDHSVDPETQARLEALLEAAGIGKLATGDGKQLADPEVLRRLTSSVSCALDEAAAALTRMRNENPRAQPERSLVEACTDGDVGTVRKLLTEGRSVHETTEEGESLLSLACSAGYYELAQVLLAMHANVEDRGIKGDCTPLMEAASSGYVDIVRLLIHHGADVNAQSSSGNTPLMYACAGGHEEAVRVLLDAGANVEDHNENGHTPLMEAASAGHVNVAAILLERGAGINTHSNEFKESALTLACYKGHLDMVRFLLEAGADQEHKTDEMHTALMEASMDGHVEVARLLLDSGAQVNMPTDSFESPLTLAACGGHVDLALLLIERGANIEEVNDEGYTPLMEAAREGHEDMVAVLLKKGANINAQTEETQETALTLACCGGFLEVADFLIKNGAELELGASTPLMEAAQEGHLDLVKYLLEANADVNAQTQTGDTALTYSCENGHTEVAKLLLQYNANLEHESEGGRTPLMKACRAGHLCTVKFLLSQNADVNKQTTNNDHTPLSLASAGGHIAVVELLLAHQADPFHKLKDNSTMLIEAAKGGHTNVVQLLLDYPHSIMMSGGAAGGGATGAPPTTAPTAPATTATAAPISATSAVAPPPHMVAAASAAAPLPHLAAAASPPNTTTTSSGTSVGLHEVPDAVRVLTHDDVHFGSKATPSITGKHTAPVQKSLLRKSRLTATIDANSLTSPEVQQVRNPPGDGKEDPNILDKGSTGKSQLTLDPQFFQRQQMVEEFQRVEQELKEKGEILAEQSVALTTLLTPTTPPGPPPDHSLSSGDGSAAVENMVQLFCEGMVCSSTGIFHAGGVGGGGSTALGSGGSNAGCAVAPAHTMLVHGATQPPGVTTPISSPQQLQTSPITAPSDVVPATAISDRPKAKPAWKKEGKNVRKQAAFQATLQFPQHAPHVNQLKHLAQISDEHLNVLQQHPTPSYQQRSEDAVLGGLLDSSAGTSPTGKQQQQHQFLDTAAATHFTTHVQQQLDMVSPIHIHHAAHDAQMRNIQGLSGVSSQCELLQRRCPLLAQTDEDTFVDLAKASSKLDQTLDETLEGFSLDDVANAASAERERLRLIAETYLEGVEEGKRYARGLTAPAPFQVISTDHGALQVVPTDQNALQYLYGSVQAGATTSAQATAGGFQLQCPVRQELLVADKAVQQHQHQQQLQQQAMARAGAATAPPLPPSSSAVVPSPFKYFLKAPPPPWVKGNDVLESGAGVREQVQAGTQTSPASATPSVEQAASIKKPPIVLPAPLPTTAPPPVGPGTLPSASAMKGKKARYQQQQQQQQQHHQQQHQLQQQKSTQAPPLHIENHAGYKTQPGAAVDSSQTAVNGATESGDGGVAAAAAAAIATAFSCMDVDSATDSNNDTALTLACAGGHEELVELLLSRGANIEHRDKKGFTPLILAATAGHEKVVEILLNHTADMEAQSERTKDTPLSLACSGGRYEVVELLLSRGANKEHRNVSDYTPLSLAASGGYVNIIKLLLSHGAEINSRTGSKLGISPLMLAAMNGHTAAVKLLLDMGSDINAQIETNRNTALTLACFQGRHEVVSLLLDRRANVEHRAKTGLTPLMEAASGGYVEVGRVLLDKGADVNAPPVPSSRDTALTIAADKGHCRFVELLLNRSAQVEVKNKKGNSPLWLAANGGHLAVVELLYNVGADIDSQDNRKVSCLMAAFRKGHVKVVKWMVNHVMQFPSDQEMTRYITTVSDKELLEKCQECIKIIRVAKDQQAAKANKNASILLEELFLEKTREESKRAAAARRRERKKKKKLEKKEEKRKLQEENQKNEMMTAAVTAGNGGQNQHTEEEEDDAEDDEEEKLELKVRVVRNDAVSNNSGSGSGGGVSSDSPGRGGGEGEEGDSGIDANSQGSCSSNDVKPTASGALIKRKEKKKKKQQTTGGGGSQVIHSTVGVSQSLASSSCTPSSSKSLLEDKKSQNFQSSISNKSGGSSSHKGSGDSKVSMDKLGSSHQEGNLNKGAGGRQGQEGGKGKVRLLGNAGGPFHPLIFESSRHPADREDFEATGSEHYISASKGKKSVFLIGEDVTGSGKGSNSTNGPKQGGNSASGGASSGGGGGSNKRDEGWKEVVRKYLNSPFRSKKVSVPLNAISRVIGRGGSNINAIRTATGAHIEVEKQSKGQGERIITLKGSAEATKQAHSLIAALIQDPDVDILQLLPKSAKSAAAVWEKSVNTAKSKPGNKSSGGASSSSLSSSATGSSKGASGGGQGVNCGGIAPLMSRSAAANYSSVSASRVTAPRLVAAAAVKRAQLALSTSIKTTMSYTSVIMTPSGSRGGGGGTVTSNSGSSSKSGSGSAAQLQQPSTTCASTNASQTFAAKLTESAVAMTSSSNQSMSIPSTAMSAQQQPSTAPTLSKQHQQIQQQQIHQQQQLQQHHQPQQVQQQVAEQQIVVSMPSATVVAPVTVVTQRTTITPTPLPPAPTPVSVAPTTLEYSLFNDTFTKVAQQSMWGRENDTGQKGMNFASVAAASVAGSTPCVVSTVLTTSCNKFLDPSPPQVDASKAPGYRGNNVCSPVAKVGGGGGGGGQGNIVGSVQGGGVQVQQVSQQVQSAASAAVSPQSSSSFFPGGGGGGGGVVPNPPGVEASQPPPHSVPPPPFRPVYPTDVEHTMMATYQQQQSATAVSMSRLNPRAPDFSTSMKPPPPLFGGAPPPPFMQAAPQPPGAPPTLLPNNNVISFQLNKGGRPNGQPRWPFIATAYATGGAGSGAGGGGDVMMATIASLSQQEDLLACALENGASPNVSPSSPQQQTVVGGPGGGEDRKVPPRPIGTERTAWKNYTAAANAHDVEINPSWMMETKMGWPTGAAIAPPPHTLDRHHIFRQTPNPGVSFSRIPMPNDIHLMDSPYQGSLDSGGGLMHSLPVLTPAQHYSAPPHDLQDQPWDQPRHTLQDHPTIQDKQHGWATKWSSH